MYNMVDNSTSPSALACVAPPVPAIFDAPDPGIQIEALFIISPGPSVFFIPFGDADPLS